MPVACKKTAVFLVFADNLFDSVNGSYFKNRYAKPLLGPVTPHSPHKKKWTESKTIIKSMQILNKANGKKELVPTLENWITTLEGIEKIVSRLENDHGVTSVWMRHLNQDPLENFFGAIRSHGCRNINPTSAQFASAFATLLINNMSSVHAPGFNCENDNAGSLYALVLNNDYEVNKTCEVNVNDIVEINLTPLASKSDPRVLAPLKYVSGYFIKKSQDKIFHGCQICKNSISKRVKESMQDEIGFIDLMIHF